MSRRDTIIIAVLLNAGLLIILFATSLKSDKIESPPPAITVLSSNNPPETKEITPASTVVSTPTPTSSAAPDQVDQMIQQYVTPQVVTSVDSNPNFLADLQALGSAPTPVAEPVAPMVSTAQVAAAPVIFKEVKVKKGDVLEKIARQNRVTVSDIMKANQMTSTRLKIGQVLKIPNKEGSAVARPVASTEGAQYYTVKAGDNPWTIAVKHHMKVEELLKLNNLDEQKAKRLKAGDKIRVK